MSLRHFRFYAGQHGAEHRLSTDNFFGFSFEQAPDSNHNSAACLSKLRPLFDPEFDQYDKVLIVDVDVLIKNFRKNIFPQCTKDIAGVTYLVPPQVCLGAVREDLPAERYGPELGLRGFCISGGMMILSREFRIQARRLFTRPDPEQYRTDENYYMQQIVSPEEVQQLDFRWNFNCRLIPHFEHPYFVHFPGRMKRYMPEYYHNTTITLAPEDEVPLDDKYKQKSNAR